MAATHHKKNTTTGVFMVYRSLRHLLALLLMACPLWAIAQSTTEGQGKPFYRGLWDETVGSTTTTLRDGDWNVFIPLQTYHMPFAYSKEQRDEQNNNPMPGFGIGRSRDLKNGNSTAIYALEFHDSYDKPEWHLGYNYNWLWRTEGGIRYGLGATFGLMMRADYASYTPLPFILPVFHVGMGRVSLEASYVPGVKKGTANVAFFWLRIQ
jgi:lipid IVA palmitoyltransferase